MKRIREKTTQVALLVTLLIMIAAVLRLWLLGFSSFSADNMDFYKLAIRNQSIVELWKNPPWVNQIPLNETFSILMVRIGLPPTPLVVRLPFAFMGILTVYFVWRIAHKNFGIGPGLMTLTLAVFNPYQIYFSRTSYHYAGAMCWSAALLWIFWSMAGKINSGNRPHIKDWIVWLPVAVLACHMHISVWIVAAFQGLAFILIGLKLPKNLRFGFYRDFICAGLALALVMSRWIYRALAMIANDTEQLGSDATSEFIRLVPAYFAGENTPAILLLLLFACIALFGLISPGRKISSNQAMGVFCILNLIAVLTYVGVVGGGLAKIAYFSAIWPHIILFLGAGSFAGLVRIMKQKKVVYAAITLSLLYISATIAPAWAIVKLDGRPTPYYLINNWVEKNLPSGTPILTDRWYEPWNELAIHNPGNINYTFTVPDEPLENYQHFDWRKTATDFFARNPEAAFLELNPFRYQSVMERWSYPDEYFARKAVITNQAALTMRKWKVFPTMEYANPATNRILSVIYYNTRDDLLARFRNAAKSTAIFWGAGFPYEKSGPMGIFRLQTEQFMDWRMLQQRGELEVYNLTDAPADATIEITAVSPNGPKLVTSNGQRVQFTAGQMQRWNIGPMKLEPGKNLVVLEDPRWEQAANPLLIANATVVSTNQPAAAGAAP